MDTVLRTRRNPAHIALISVITLFMLLLSGCSVVNDLTDISGAGKAFLAEIDKGNATGAAALMHSRSLASGDMAGALQSSFADRKFSSISIDSTKVENSVGTLSGKCHLADASGALQIGDLTMQLEKDGDKWKVLNISCKLS